jgi:hypothetical protein
MELKTLPLITTKAAGVEVMVERDRRQKIEATLQMRKPRVMHEWERPTSAKPLKFNLSVDNAGAFLRRTS